MPRRGSIRSRRCSKASATSSPRPSARWPTVRDGVRKVVWKTGKIVTSKAEMPEGQGLEYRDYFDYSEPVAQIPPHRILAINRGDKEGPLKVRIDVSRPDLEAVLFGQLPLEGHPHAELFRAAAIDALDRLILPSMEREVRRDLTEGAEKHAVEVFAKNLRGLLLQPPIPKQVVLAIDPGFRTGCKLAVLDRSGNLLDQAVIYPHPPQNRRSEAKVCAQGLGRQAPGRSRGDRQRHGLPRDRGTGRRDHRRGDSVQQSAITLPPTSRPSRSRTQYPHRKLQTQRPDPRFRLRHRPPDPGRTSLITSPDPIRTGQRPKPTKLTVNRARPESERTRERGRRLLGDAAAATTRAMASLPTGRRPGQRTRAVNPMPRPSPIHSAAGRGAARDAAADLGWIARRHFARGRDRCLFRRVPALPTPVPPPSWTEAAQVERDDAPTAKPEPGSVAELDTPHHQPETPEGQSDSSPTAAPAAAPKRASLADSRPTSRPKRSRRQSRHLIAGGRPRPTSRCHRRHRSHRANTRPAPAARRATPKRRGPRQVGFVAVAVIAAAACAAAAPGASPAPPGRCTCSPSSPTSSSTRPAPASTRRARSAATSFPTLDATLRSGISIGRRLQDPLAELVKIEPQNIGVGLYQHDVNPKQLKETLESVIASCVNFVGVDLNTASVPLLRHVSGLNQLTARRIVEYRKEHGPFASRDQLTQVEGIGPATFTQAAGFLKIPDGEHPLDRTWIHPESYPVAIRLLEKLEFAPEVVRDKDRLPELNEKLAEADLGELVARARGGRVHAARHHRSALARPERDPREDLPKPIFKKGILKIEDLSAGMELKGTVLNVVDFGAFVDIGLKDSGLVHISQLANRYVKSPHDVVSVGDVVTVWVMGVDQERKRVSLTMVKPGTERQRGNECRFAAWRWTGGRIEKRRDNRGPGQGRRGGGPGGRPPRPAASALTSPPVGAPRWPCWPNPLPAARSRPGRSPASGPGGPRSADQRGPATGASSGSGPAGSGSPRPGRGPGPGPHRGAAGGPRGPYPGPARRPGASDRTAGPLTGPRAARLGHLPRLLHCPRMPLPAMSRCGPSVSSSSCGKRVEEPPGSLGETTEPVPHQTVTGNPPTASDQPHDRSEPIRYPPPRLLSPNQGRPRIRSKLLRYKDVAGAPLNALEWFDRISCDLCVRLTSSRSSYSRSDETGAVVPLPPGFNPARVRLGDSHPRGTSPYAGFAAWL